MTAALVRQQRVDIARHDEQPSPTCSVALLGNPWPGSVAEAGLRLVADINVSANGSLEQQIFDVSVPENQIQCLPLAVTSIVHCKLRFGAMATLKRSDRPPYGILATLLWTVVAVGGAAVLYHARSLWTPLGVADNRGLIITLAYLWMCAVVIFAVRRRNWSVIEYFALSRPSLRVVGFGIAAQLALEII